MFTQAVIYINPKPVIQDILRESAFILKEQKGSNETAFHFDTVWNGMQETQTRPKCTGMETGKSICCQLRHLL